MDRQTTLAAVLIAGIFLVWSMYITPSEEQMRRQQQQTDSIRASREKNNTFSEKKTEKVPPSQGAISHQKEQENFSQDSLKKTEKIVFLENKKVKIGISSIGAQVVFVELKEYKNNFGKNVLLVHDKSLVHNINFPLYNNVIFNSKNVGFEITQPSDKTIECKYLFEDSRSFSFFYELPEDSYQLSASIQAENLREIIPQNINYLSSRVDYTSTLQEKNIEDERNLSTIHYKPYQDSPDDLGIRKEKEEESLQSRLKWFAFKQKFFSILYTAESEFQKPTKLGFEISENENEVMRMNALTSLAINNSSNQQFNYSIYFGPNKYSELAKLGNSSEEVLDLGWSLISLVSKGLVIPIFDFLNDKGLHIGLTILLLTLIIKMGLFPLTYRSFLSMAKMRVLRPQVEEIQKKFKKDEAIKSQQAVMALYKKAGANPLGGCFPQLLQFPILVSLFYFFPASIELRQQSFLWTNDLSSYDSILELPFSIPFYGSHVSLFTLLMAASSFIYMRMNSQGGMSTGGGGMMAQQMKIMQYFFPVMMIMWFNSYSSGLSYYYFLTNVVSLLQHLAIKKFIINEDAIIKKLEKNKQKNKNKPKSKFQKKLEEMAKQRGATR